MSNNLTTVVTCLLLPFESFHSMLDEGISPLPPISAPTEHPRPVYPKDDLRRCPSSRFRLLCTAELSTIQSQYSTVLEANTARLSARSRSVVTTRYLRRRYHWPTVPAMAECNLAGLTMQSCRGSGLGPQSTYYYCYSISHLIIT